MAYGLTFSLKAQNKRIDSLLRNYQSQPNQEKKIGSAIILLDEYYYSGYNQKGIDIGNSLLALIDTTQYSKDLSKIYNRMGTIYTSMGNYELIALQYLEKSLEISRAIKWDIGEITSYNNIGNVYRELGYYNKAFDYYQKSLTRSEIVHDSVGIAYAYKNLGIIAEAQAWDAKALEYHQRAYSIRKKLGNPTQVLSSLVNIGTVLNNQNRFSLSLPYLKSADSMARKLGSEMQPEVSLELADSYFGLGMNKLSLENNHLGLKKAVQFKKVRSIANLLTQQVNLLLKTNQLSEAQKKLYELDKHLDSIQYITGRIHYFEKSFYLDSLKGDELNALRSFKKMTLLKDSLRTLTSNEELMRKQNTFELMQKDASIEIEKAKQRSQQFIFFIIAIGLGLSIVGLLFFTNHRTKAAKVLKDEQKLVVEKNHELEAVNRELDKLLYELKIADALIKKQNLEIKIHNDQLTLDLKSRTDEILASTSRIEQFAFLVSHNLRGPITRIMGLVNLYRMVTNVDEQKQIIDKIEVSISEMGDITSDLNKILDLEAGVKLKVELIETKQLLDQVLSSISAETQYTNAEIIIRCTEVPYFFSSFKLIKSVLIQLLLNALKFKNDNKSPIITIELTKDNSNVIFMVTDNGIGIDLTKWGNQLFTPYKRFHTHKTGKGFGLFLVKLRIESLRGTIQISSECGDYTKVTFSLPQDISV